MPKLDDRFFDHMTPELTALTLAVLWQVVQFTIYSISAQKQVGTRYALSPRDTPKQLTGFAGRAQRTMNNHFESLILFTIATLALTYSDQNDTRTAALALIYLIARILYLPAYLLGLTPWRRLIWALSFLATTAMLIMALFILPDKLRGGQRPPPRQPKGPTPCMTSS